MHQIVEMLLFLARADAEAKLPNLETVNLADWLEVRRKEWFTGPRAADLRLEYSSDGPCLVKVQLPLLSQLIDNLLDNAYKYSEAGKPITVRLGSNNEAVFLAVEDAGLGIASQDLPHIFEPFYRSPQAGRKGLAGVGLGLAIAKRIAAVFGGSISVSSEAGKGSYFTLHLPRALPA